MPTSQFVTQASSSPARRSRRSATDHAVERAEDERADEGGRELLRVELRRHALQEDARAAVPQVEQRGVVPPLSLVDEVVLDLRGEGGGDGLLVPLQAALGEGGLQAADRVLELDKRAERVDRDRVDALRRYWKASG